MIEELINREKENRNLRIENCFLELEKYRCIY